MLSCSNEVLRRFPCRSRHGSRLSAANGRLMKKLEIQFHDPFIRAEETDRRRCYASKNRISVRDQLNVPTEFDEFSVFFVAL